MTKDFYPPTQSTYKAQLLAQRAKEHKPDATFGEALAFIATIIALIIIGIII